jgi:hypothetical protein
MLAQGRPFDASRLELVESLMLAYIELVEMLRLGLSLFTSHSQTCSAQNLVKIRDRSALSPASFIFLQYGFH